MVTQSDNFVALLRGINVGGANKVPMADLRALATGLGWGEVETYIASGNLMFRAADPPRTLANHLRNAMAEQMGVDVPILVLPEKELAHIAETCPFDGAGNLIHLFICETIPMPDYTRKDALIAPDESLLIQDRFVWFHAPSGAGRSKLMRQMEQVLGVAATGRNLNTVRKLVQMMDHR